MPDLTPAEKQRQQAALQMAAFAVWNERRNFIIISAFKAGYNQTDIARAMGIARSTVIRALKKGS